MFMQETDIYTRFRLADCVSRMTSPPHYIGRKWPVDRGLEQGGVFRTPHETPPGTPPYGHVGFYTAA